MTRQELREHYAGLALQAIMMRWPMNSSTEFASYAVTFADALLEAVTCKHENTFQINDVNHCKNCGKKC